MQLSARYPLFVFATVVALGALSMELRGAPPPRFADRIEPILVEYCYDCHGDGAEKGDFALDTHRNQSELLADHKIWERVWENLHRRMMPPGRKPQPSDKEREEILAWIEQVVFKLDPSKPDPGRVTIRRLNRVEYDNTIGELLRIDFKPAEDFPADDSGYGFDNIGDVLTISPVLLEKYFAAADKALEQALGATTSPAKSSRIPASSFRGDGSNDGDFVNLYTNGVTRTRVLFPESGEYRLRVKAYATRAGNELAKMEIRLSGRRLGTFSVKEQPPDSGWYEVKAQVDRKGPQDLQIAFPNDFYDPKNRNPRLRDRNLYVESLEVVPPSTPSTSAAESRGRILVKRHPGMDDEAYAKNVLRGFVGRAFRRPPSAEELQGLFKLYQDAAKHGDDFEQAIRVPLKATLLSPNFLFRGEYQPNPSNPAQVHEVDEFALASRLSYFLWSSMPDDELFRHAIRGTLRKNLTDQVERMLRDPKASALGSNFAGQWLQLRDLELITPDPNRFPEFDEKLKISMRRETEAFFHYLLSEDRPLSDFLTGNYTFVNERLARFYGLKGDFSDKFEWASLRGTNRGGILTHASVLTITSNPTRTSPVKRGKWVLDNILGAPPKEPPEDVPELNEETDSEKGLTLREQMQKHSSDARCATCHTAMDPLGFALENFNAIGRWRSHERGKPLSAAGQLPTGERFDGALELQRLLIKDRRDSFVRCLTEAMLTYALGRGLEYYDRMAIDGICHQVKKNGYGFSSLVVAIVESVPFQKRRGDPLRAP